MRLCRWKATKLVGIVRTTLAGSLLLVCWPTAAYAQTDAPDAAASEGGDAAQVATAVLDRLNAAWNAGDATGFTAEFTDDVYVINIFGAVFRGRADLTRQVQAIFDGVFKDSRHVDRELEIARYLDDHTVLAVSSARVAVPAGPLSPETRNRQTVILVREGDRWRIRHWHNTTVGGAAERR